MTAPLRICYFGTYRANYSHNQLMIKRLRRAGAEVAECHAMLWHGDEDRNDVAEGGWLRPRFWWRVIKTYASLLRAYTKVGPYDVMVVGYPGQLEVLLARLLSRLRRRPLAWDIYMSLYLIMQERGITARRKFTGRLMKGLERTGTRLPELLIVDTADYLEWYGRNYGIDPARCILIPHGADDEYFCPQSAPQSAPSAAPQTPSSRHDGEANSSSRANFRVIYYGSFILNHGVEYIVEAAHLLANDPCIRFELIGRGPQRAAVEALVRQYALTNVTFVDWLDKVELVRRVSDADVCLGSFGTAPQSLITVHNKVYEGLAMARPVVTGDSPAVRRLFTHGEHLYLCERANPQSLAAAITALRCDAVLREHLSARGHALYQERFSIDCLGRELLGRLEGLE